jgi:two-component system, LuxR family, response regulator FixJ
VDVHRARIMDKLGAKNAADLMRIVLSEANARPRMSAS